MLLLFYSYICIAIRNCICIAKILFFRRIADILQVNIWQTEEDAREATADRDIPVQEDRAALFSKRAGKKAATRRLRKSSALCR